MVESHAAGRRADAGALARAPQRPHPFQPFVRRRCRTGHMEHSGPGVTPPSMDPAERTPAADLSDAGRAAAGDVRAFERLYQAHVAVIHSLTRRMMGSEHADEITQDVFVRAWQKIGTFRGEARFGTWLHRLAINVILARRTW